MRGQSQIVVYVLLLLITLVLVFTAVSWGSGISQSNVDIGRVTAAENWMKSFDASIQSVIRSGGGIRVDYPLGSEISLSDVGLDDTVEVRMPVSLDLPNQWINITSVSGAGLIRERKDGDYVRIQLSYPLRPGFAVDLYTDGPQIATPHTIMIERNSTYTQTVGSATYTVAKVRIRFM